MTDLVLDSPIETTLALDENHSPTFNRILGQFYGFTIGDNIAEKKPRGRPPKFKPAPPIGIVKNAISDEDSDEIWVSHHDQRLLRMEFNQMTVEDGRAETDVIQELSELYDLSYKAVYHVVGTAAGN
jgi:hypothetical protein